MSSSFITNQEKLLSEVINNILPSTKNFYALVGYFYLSGFVQLAEKLKDKQVQILIGMDIERGLDAVIKEVAPIGENKKKSNLEIRQNYFRSLVDLYGRTDILDGRENETAFKIFVSKIQSGTLEIRKTKEPNHAKLYIFEKQKEYSDNGENPGVVITGSSNLTISGLKNRFEINVKSYDARDYQVSIEMFQELWENSVLIVNKNNFDEFVDEVIERIWIDKLPKPYLVYIRVLYELFNIEDRKVKLPADIAKNVFNLKYQEDAIKQGLNIIEKHNGVIIADVVGLGKSIIASAIAANLNLQTIIICPPHLKNQWSDYGKKFKFNPHIYGSGSIDKALREFEEVEGEKLILVDEAHKYRNPITKDYDNLKKLCAGNKVILLTATPFNNKPQDIFSLISLFQIPAKSTIRTVDNLFNRFRDLIIEYKKIKDIEKESERKKEIKKLADKMRDIIFDLVIRRSRVDLEKRKEYWQDLKKQGISFSDVQPPKLLTYKLGELEGKYIDTLEKITDEKKGFVGARYKPTEYILPERKEKYEKEFEKLFKEKNLLNLTQKNLALFMRRLLVHRFESSIYAFGSTLDNMIASMQKVQQWYEKVGVVPIFKRGDLVEPEDIIDDTSDNDEEMKKIDENLDKLKKEKGYYYIKSQDLKPEFIEKLKKDIQLLQEIKKEWFEDFGATEDDPKIKKLKQTLRRKLAENQSRKIVIFSGYSDTVEYVYEKIKDEFRVFRYTSKHASQANKEIIRKNFDAGLKKSEQANDYDILVASDAISEGFNLHRAGIIINYDIPYNPTRVIQRVGRINRINKKVFGKIYIYNAFPSLVGEQETNVKKISTLKINMINALLGTDMKTLTDEEEIESFYQKKYAEAEKMEEEESWETRFKQELDGVDKKILAQALSEKVIPFRTRIRRSARKKKSGVLVFAKKGNDCVFKFASTPEQTPKVLSRQQALELLRAEAQEKAQKVSQNFETIFQSLSRKLFADEIKLKSTRADIDLANKIEKMQEKFPQNKDYLADLYEVAVNLRALSDYSARYIRNLDLKEKNIIHQLKKQITPNYLKTKIKQANQIDEGEEILILAEELI